jgi:hypothetical protein
MPAIFLHGVPVGPSLRVWRGQCGWRGRSFRRRDGPTATPWAQRAGQACRGRAVVIPPEIGGA